MSNTIQVKTRVHRIGKSENIGTVTAITEYPIGTILTVHWDANTNSRILARYVELHNE